MTKNCTVIRYNQALKETDGKIVEFLDRFNHINLSDKSMWATRPTLPPPRTFGA